MKLMLATTMATALTLTPLLAANDNPAEQLDEAAVPVVRALNFLEAAGHEVGAAPSFASATRVILLGMAILVVVFAFRVFGSRFLKK